MELYRIFIQSYDKPKRMLAIFKGFWEALDYIRFQYDEDAKQNNSKYYYSMEVISEDIEQEIIKALNNG